MSGDTNPTSSFNPQTYRCPTHGLISGDEVDEEEIDWGELKHTCLLCHQTAPYVGRRQSPTDQPVRYKRPI